MIKRILILDAEGQEPPGRTPEFIHKQFRVLITSDSKNIIPIAKKFDPDVFILDYTMAGHTSEDICQRIEWCRHFGHIPTVLSTEHMQENVDYNSLGCDDILYKPYDLNELIEKAEGLVWY